MRLPMTCGENNPVLRTISSPVPKITKEIKKLIRDMEETMFAEEGVGLAAPQIGINLKIAVMLLDGKRVVPIINPEIIDRSGPEVDGEEGCLSLRGQWGHVARHEALTLEYMNLKGETVTMKLTGFNARIAQHETDHLNGILFIDRIK